MFVAPQTLFEERLVNIWVEMFGFDRIGVHDNFFELGGHSLLAIQVVSRIRNAFQIELSLRSLFERPTIAGLAEYIERIPRMIHRLQTPYDSRINGREEIEL